MQGDVEQMLSVTEPELYQASQGQGNIGKERQPQTQSGNIPRPRTMEEYRALPPGAEYISPQDGQTYRKPNDAQQ